MQSGHSNTKAPKQRRSFNTNTQYLNSFCRISIKKTASVSPNFVFNLIIKGQVQLEENNTSNLRVIPFITLFISRPSLIEHKSALRLFLFIDRINLEDKKKKKLSAQYGLYILQLACSTGVRDCSEIASSAEKIFVSNQVARRPTSQLRIAWLLWIQFDPGVKGHNERYPCFVNQILTNATHIN